MEQKPGIPPSAAYIEKLVESMRTSRPDAIITTAYYGKKEADSLSLKTGAKAVVLPHDVGSMPGTDDWFSFMDAVIASVK